jgi:hypothetical protein
VKLRKKTIDHRKAEDGKFSLQYEEFTAKKMLTVGKAVKIKSVRQHFCGKY